MSAYHVSFFKTLLSSDGHPSKCLQYLDIADAESSALAVEAACKAFEALYGGRCNLHADSIDVIADQHFVGNFATDRFSPLEFGR
jgi:hypothetical protein